MAAPAPGTAPTTTAAPPMPPHVALRAAILKAEELAKLLPEDSITVHSKIEIQSRLVEARLWTAENLALSGAPAPK